MSAGAAPLRLLHAEGAEGVGGKGTDKIFLFVAVVIAAAGDDKSHTPRFCGQGGDIGGGDVGGGGDVSGGGGETATDPGGGGEASSAE